MTTAQLDHLRAIDAHLERKLAKSEYIPHYSALAEAGWIATRAALKWAIFMHENGQVGEGLLESILTAFPLELLES